MNDTPLWDSGGWSGFERLTGDVATDVAVVGLGGSGLAAVEEAVSHNRQVVGIDAGAVAGEAAGRNGGFLLAGMSLFYHEAKARWGPATAKACLPDESRGVGSDLAQPASRQTGSLRIGDSDDEIADIADEIAALRADGFEAHPYEGPEGAGMLVPGDGVCNPMQRCRDLVPGLLDAGVSLFERTPAITIEPNRVTTPEGLVEAEHVVVAVDGRIELLLPELAGRVKTARLEMLATEAFEVRYRRPVYTAFGYIYWQQLPDGRLALGGLRQRFAEHSWSFEPGPTAEVQAALDGYLGEIGVEAEVSHRWAGHAAYTDDRAPIYEEIRPGVWAVGGYCGHGNVLGSVYGRAAVRSALAAEKEPLL